MLQIGTSLIQSRQKIMEISDNRQHFENRILHFDGRLVFLPPPDRSRQFGEIHVRLITRMAMSFCCQRRQRYRLEHAERYEAPRRFEPCSPNQSTHARTCSEGPGAPADGEITLSRGERSPPCLLPSRKLKSGILGGPQDAIKTRGRGSPRRQFSG